MMGINIKMMLMSVYDRIFYEKKIYILLIVMAII